MCSLLGGFFNSHFFVYSCCPDSIFLDMALSLKEQEKAEDFGITLKLDICGLYKVGKRSKSCFQTHFIGSLHIIN